MNLTRRRDTRAAATGHARGAPSTTHRRARIARVVGALAALVGSSLAVATASVVSTVAPAAGANNLNVAVGGGTPTGIDAQSFFPGLAVISTGDSITWNFLGVHTVNLYTPPGPPSAPGTGDGTFNGTSDPESSGIKTPAPGDNTYTVTFNSAGNFVYFCALHPGMHGLVQVVDPGTSTPARTTQTEANTIGAQERQADISAGQAARDAFKPTTTPAANGTTQLNAADGISEAPPVVATLTPPSNPGASGSATMLFTSPTNLHVVVTMSGLPPNHTSDIPNHIHSGQCGVSSPPKGAPNDILVTLTPLSSDGNGNGTATTDFTWDPNTMGPPVIPSNTWYVNVHDPSSPSTSISCGNAIAHPASNLRFFPSPVTINAGDTVSWTQMDAHELHPIFIGPPDKEPGDPFAAPSGGNTASSPNSAISAGPLGPGDNFKVTFAAPGRYQYRCTLHDVVGMIGEVDVLPTGYRSVGSDGGVFTHGTSTFNGSEGGTKLNSPIVATASTPTNKGYWMVGADGGVFNLGDAGFFGSMGGSKLNKPIVGMVVTPTGNGYWLVASDGGVFNFGDAKFLGSMGGTKLNQPIVGIAVTPTGAGYVLVASDGGAFNFGDAAFFGSMGGTKLNKPVVGILITPSGAGYLMVASDGGVFTFGDAKFVGSLGNKPLNKPIVAIIGAADGAGYWMVALDGGVFTFGSAKFFGSEGGTTLNKPIVGMTF